MVQVIYLLYFIQVRRCFSATPIGRKLGLNGAGRKIMEWATHKTVSYRFWEALQLLQLQRSSAHAFATCRRPKSGRTMKKWGRGFQISGSQRLRCVSSSNIIFTFILYLLYNLLNLKSLPFNFFCLFLSCVEMGARVSGWRSQGGHLHQQWGGKTTWNPKAFSSWRL